MIDIFIKGVGKSVSKSLFLISKKVIGKAKKCIHLGIYLEKNFVFSFYFPPNTLYINLICFYLIKYVLLEKKKYLPNILDSYLRISSIYNKKS